MADPHWSSESEASLSELQARGRQVSFYRALMTLEALLPQSVPMGFKGPASQELIRIRPSLSLACPPTDLEEIYVDPETGRALVTTTFLGLYGVDSPLPASYPEHLAQIAEEESGERIRRFLDTFHHRLYSLLYRAWKRSRPVSVDDHTNPFYRALAITGYDRQLGLGGAVLPRLAEARLKVLRNRTAEGLEAAFRLRIGQRYRIEQLQLRMVKLPTDQRSQLGKSNCQLGRSTVLGARIGDHNKIRVKTTASDHLNWIKLAPGGALNRQINRTIRGYLRDPIDYDLEVRMDSESVPPLQLGSRQVALGRDAWLGWPSPEARWTWQRRDDAEPADFPLSALPSSG